MLFGTTSGPQSGAAMQALKEIEPGGLIAPVIHGVHDCRLVTPESALKRPAVQLRHVAESTGAYSPGEHVVCSRHAVADVAPTCSLYKPGEQIVQPLLVGEE